MGQWLRGFSCASRRGVVRQGLAGCGAVVHGQRSLGCGRWGSCRCGRGMLRGQPDSLVLLQGHYAFLVRVLLALLAVPGQLGAAGAIVSLPSCHSLPRRLRAVSPGGLPRWLRGRHHRSLGSRGAEVRGVVVGAAGHPAGRGVLVLWLGLSCVSCRVDPCCCSPGLHQSHGALRSAAWSSAQPRRSRHGRVGAMPWCLRGRGCSVGWGRCEGRELGRRRASGLAGAVVGVAAVGHPPERRAGCCVRLQCVIGPPEWPRVAVGG